MSNNYGGFSGVSNSCGGSSGSITGLDEERARYDIENLKNSMETFSIAFFNSFSYLFGELNNVWASPNAKSFYDIYNKKIVDVDYEIHRTGRILLQNVVRAYNIMARAQGISELNLSYYVPNASDTLDSVVYSESGLPPLYDQLNGVVGMNTSLVVNYILPEFNSKISEVFNLLNEIPHSIALYDSEGAQQGAFDTASLNYKVQVETVIDDVVSALKTNIEAEVDTTLLAKQQTIDTLANG